MFSNISNENGIVFNNKIALDISYRSIQKILDLADKLCNSNDNDIRSAFVANINEIDIEAHNGKTQHTMDSCTDANDCLHNCVAIGTQSCLHNTQIKHNVCDKNKNLDVEKRAIVYNLDLPDIKNGHTDNEIKTNSWINRTEQLIEKDKKNKRFAYDVAVNINNYIKSVRDVCEKNENFAIIVQTTSAKNGIMLSIIDNIEKKFDLHCKMKFDIEKKNLYFLDLMCFYQFAYICSDDMNLACLLKSDFFLFTDDDLYEICSSYEKNYWYNNLYDKLKSKVCTGTELGEKVKYACDILSIFESCDTIMEITICLEKIVKYYPQYLSMFEMLKKIVYNEYEIAKKNDDFIFNYDISNFVERTNNSVSFEEIEDRQERDIVRVENGEIFFSTIHGVKGMEFDNVILLDIQEQRHENAGKSSKINFFNNGFFYKISKFTIDNVFDMEGLKTDMEKYKMQIDSEKWRLLYVAITRAKKRFAYFGDIDKTKYGISFFSDFVESDY